MGVNWSPRSGDGVKGQNRRQGEVRLAGLLAAIHFSHQGFILGSCMCLRLLFRPFYLLYPTTSPHSLTVADSSPARMEGMRIVLFIMFRIADTA